MLSKTGIPAKTDIEGVFPGEERLSKGPAAVFECFQNIPCNPCQTACKRGAIKHMEDINERPSVDYDKCNGCGICVSRCPGLAIMVVDTTWSEDKALIKIPYEFAPLPGEGTEVTALNRAGEPIGRAKVIKALNTAVMDKTAIISIEVDKGLVKDVRNIKLDENTHGDEETIICRCSDLDLDYIRDLIAQGYKSVDELKRIARLGMGPCQGRNCIPLVQGELSRATGKSVSEISPGTYRPAIKSVPLGALAAYKEGDHE